MAGIVISRERQEELHKSLQRKLDGIAEEDVYKRQYCRRGG